jgi:hypothetical protein
VGLPARFVRAPGAFGGIKNPLAGNGSTVFAAVLDLPVPMTVRGLAESALCLNFALRGLGCGAAPPESDQGVIARTAWSAGGQQVHGLGSHAAGQSQC